MKLTAADIAEISKLLDESHFGELRLQMGDFKLRISRGGSAPLRDAGLEASAPSPAPSSGSSAPLGKVEQSAQATAPAAPAGAPGAGEVDVPAPLLGNFYSAPRPGEPPFVEVGDSVTEDTTIGIIEVMKLMNPIRAGISGTVIAILAENGNAIEQGQPLIRVKTG